MNILIVNDDGVDAPGIKALTEAAKGFGKITVIAPDKPQSGMGHAVTLNSSLRISKKDENGITIYSCSGTPVDCVKIGVNKLLDEKPDIILSGINHGANSSVNVLYSGTMSAAVEGAMEGIPSIGFSLCNHDIDADFTASKHFVKQIISDLLKQPLRKHLCLNVNIPNVPIDLITGVKICKQAKGNWNEDFIEREDPMGKKYYWLSGKYELYDKDENSDEVALQNNFVTVVPIQFDMTNYKDLEELKFIEQNVS